MVDFLPEKSFLDDVVVKMFFGLQSKEPEPAAGS
jgi:hypothetical protein